MRSTMPASLCGLADSRDKRGIQAGYRRCAGVPALDVMLLLKRRGAAITYSDPHVPALNVDGIDLASEPQEAAASADCVVIVTDHSAFDYPALVERAQLVLDTRNALKGFVSPKVVRL